MGNERQQGNRSVISASLSGIKPSAPAAYQATAPNKIEASVAPKSPAASLSEVAVPRPEGNAPKAIVDISERPSSPPASLVESNKSNPTALNSVKERQIGAPQSADAAVKTDAEVKSNLNPAIFLWFLPVIFFAGLYFRYLRSESARVRSLLGKYVNQFEVILDQNESLLQSIQNNLESAAEAYVKEVRSSYLRTVPLDQLRPLASGARLQPLYSRGIKTLLDCQGLSIGDLMQFRGIGPDSAAKIFSAYKYLTKVQNDRPIKRPDISAEFPPSELLFGWIYNSSRVQTILSGQREPLEKFLQELKSRCHSVRTETTFLLWLFRSESTTPLKEVIAAAHATGVEMQGAERFGLALATAGRRLNEANEYLRRPIQYHDIVADALARESHYDAVVAKLLGENLDSSPIQNTQTGKPPSLSTATDGLVSIRTSGTAPLGYSIPPLKPGLPVVECWVPQGTSIRVKGFTISGGMVYVGGSLRSCKQYTMEPALIDPALEVQKSAANCHERTLTYWPSYSLASPAARASYLQWLEGGRQDPAADIGYVFLFFYGLERRVLSDQLSDPAVKTELPAIVAEVRRLRSIYAADGSFADYSSELLDFIQTTSSLDQKLIQVAEVPLQKGLLTFDLRRQLGAVIRAGKPVPVSLAYPWFYNDPRTHISIPAERCTTVLPALFALEYKKRLGEGLILAENKARLTASYKPASASFPAPLTKAFDLPDVTVLSTPYGKLQAIGDACMQQLDAYGRFIGRNPDKAHSVEALVLLPAVLWPEAIQQGVLAFRERSVSTGEPIILKLGEMMRLFLNPVAPARATFTSLCRVLNGLGLGIEPDVRFGGNLPSLEESVAIFASDMPEKTTSGFGVTGLLLQLASFVAASDGEFSDDEAKKIGEHIHGTAELTLPEQQRLIARMATYRKKAPSALSLKKSIENIEPNARGAVVDLLITILHPDGLVSPSEVKALETIYRLVDMDPGMLYRKLHTLAAQESGVVVSEGQKAGLLQLNAEKIAQLKITSAAVTDKLRVIFDANVGEEEAEMKHEVSKDPPIGSIPTLLNLDSSHSELLTVLLSRPRWTRAEFDELCVDKGLMADGAVERLNEAAFDKFDQPIIEGEDPLEIIAQLFLGEKSA